MQGLDRSIAICDLRELQWRGRIRCLRSTTGSEGTASEIPLGSEKNMIRWKEIIVLEYSDLILAILFESDLSKSNGAGDRFGLPNVYDVSSGRNRRRRLMYMP